MRRKSDNLFWGMWWVALAVFFAGWICSLSGCGAKEEAVEEPGRFVKVSSQKFDSDRVKVFKDTETGTEYLFIDGIYKGGVVVMPEPVEEETFTVETEPMVFSSAQTATVAKMETVAEELPTEVDESPLESIGSFKVTAYCSCEKCCGKTPDDPWYGITATGTKATEGRTIAVDPKVIPYGTVVYFDGIDGFGGYVAEDCGGAIKGKDIDLYFDSHAEALNWGVREQEVFLYKEDLNG